MEAWCRSARERSNAKGRWKKHGRRGSDTGGQPEETHHGLICANEGELLTLHIRCTAATARRLFERCCDAIQIADCPRRRPAKRDGAVASFLRKSRPQSRRCRDRAFAHPRPTEQLQFLATSLRRIRQVISLSYCLLDSALLTSPRCSACVRTAAAARSSSTKEKGPWANFFLIQDVSLQSGQCLLSSEQLRQGAPRPHVHPPHQDAPQTLPGAVQGRVHLERRPWRTEPSSTTPASRSSCRKRRA